MSAMNILYRHQNINNFIENWLYGEYDETKYKTFVALYGIPGVHQYLDYLLDSRADQEYFNRYGMDYSDIHDPRKLRSTGSGSALVRTTLNLGFLYGDDDSDKSKKKN